MNFSFGTVSQDFTDVYNALLMLGLVSPNATRSTVLAAFQTWAYAHGYTPTAYGSRWDDLAQQALVQAASNSVVASPSRRFAPRLRGYGYSADEHDDEQGSGLRTGDGNQGFTDIASPPPPPPQVSTASDWSNPYGASGGGGPVAVSSPPLVAVDGTVYPGSGSSSSSGFSWSNLFGGAQRVASGLVDIFGRPVAGPPVAPVQSSGLPLAAWVAIGVGGIVVLGIAARSLRASRRTATAGYRRRKNRR